MCDPAPCPLQSSCTGCAGALPLHQLPWFQVPAEVLTPSCAVCSDARLQVKQQSAVHSLTPDIQLTLCCVWLCLWQVRIVRIFNTYGPRMALDDGRVVSNFVAQALTKQPITIYGDGKQVGL